MPNFFNDNEDLQFYFEKGLDWTALVETTEFGFRQDDAPASVQECVEQYRDFAELVGRFAAEEVDPHTEEIDTQKHTIVDGECVIPPRMTAIFEQIKALDLHWLNIPRELGGMNAPMLMTFVNAELMSRADVSVAAHNGFHGGMAMAALIYSILEETTSFDAEKATITETRFMEAIEEMASGEAWGAMDITEPDAGSDMAKLRTYGEQDEDGNWFITGEKIFITSGHGKYHYVIARTESQSDPNDPFAGLGGLSMFLVPAWHDKDGKRVRTVELSRIEDKMGHNGSVTASLIFDKSPAHLIGKRGEGFRYMLTLMNNARIGVGFESIGLCEAAYRKAAAYAAERPSMGKTIDKHEMIAEYLDEMRTDIQAMRALAMRAAVDEELAVKKKLALDHAPPTSEIERKRLEREIKRHKAAARKVTPLLKHIASEKAVEMARKCIQIHGGNGYMKEYGCEKLMRDALVMPIYEGTSEIQSLMAMKDTLGAIMKQPQKFVADLAQANWRGVSARDPLERRVARIVSQSLGVQQMLVRRTATDKMKSVAGRPVSEWSQAFLKDWNPKRDFSFAMLHAQNLMRVLTDHAICEVLLDQAKRFPERRELLERYLDRAEPRVRFHIDKITTSGRHVLETLAGEGQAAGAAQ